MEKAFVIKFKNVENTVMYVRYFESGFIKSYHFDTAIEMGEHQENFIRAVFPFTIKDLAYIAKYDNFLYQNKGISKAYPETYLSQKRWENED